MTCKENGQGTNWREKLVDNNRRQEEKNYRMILHDQMKKKYRIRIIIDKPVSVFAIVCIVGSNSPTHKYTDRSGQEWCWRIKS